MIKELIKRNIPILYLGLLTVIVFGVIIIAYLIRGHSSPILTEVNDTEPESETTTFTNPQSTQNGSQKTDTGPKAVGENQNLSGEKTETTPTQPTNTIPALEISYTAAGFNPKNAKAKLNQTITWVNKTDKSITLEPLTERYKVLDGGVEILPGKSFSMVADKPGFWSYEEKSTQSFGSIYTLNE